eukprot:TRINITY_DN2335_c0_g1_i2.p1 TRINITY_DN2335_c0_g1~~TRINITY_DN2335_c0_g1_i2.p1  ORF type:complete len:763 (+),score=111.85 TRINITY_DN2335_c0_g1_i2:596-2884(+)
MNHLQRLQNQPDQFSRSVKALNAVATFSNPRLDRVKGTNRKAITSLPPGQQAAFQKLAMSLGSIREMDSEMFHSMGNLEFEREGSQNVEAGRRRCQSECFEHSWDYCPVFYDEKKLADKSIDDSENDNDNDNENENEIEVLKSKPPIRFERTVSSIFVTGLKQGFSSGPAVLSGEGKEPEKRDKLFSGHHRMSSYGMAPVTRGVAATFSGLSSDISQALESSTTISTTSSSSSSSVPTHSSSSSSSSSNQPSSLGTTKKTNSKNSFIANIFYDEKNSIVIRGTLSALVKHLADEVEPDQAYITEFLVIYKYFLTPAELFERLAKRFTVEALYINGSDQAQLSHITTSIRLRILNVFKRWIDSQYEDLIQDPTLLSSLRNFVEKDIIAAGFQSWGKNLTSLLNAKVSMVSVTQQELNNLEDMAAAIRKKSRLDTKKRQGLNETFFTGQAFLDSLEQVSNGLPLQKLLALANWMIELHLLSPVSEAERFFNPSSFYFFEEVDEKSIPKSVKPRQEYPSFLDLYPPEVARQLVMIEQSYFCRIRNPELLFVAWKGPNKNQTSPNVLTLIQWFNKISNWVASEIVTSPNLRHRAALLSRFIQMAEYCKQIKSYNTLMEILSALGTTPIQRLKRTWQALPAKEATTYKELQDFMSNLQNFKNYRNEMRENMNKSYPVLPYFGLLLQDLINTEEVIKMNKKSRKIGMIDFSRYRVVAATIAEFHNYQQRRFHFVVVRPIERMLLESLTILAEKDLYQNSKMCEPASLV